MTLAEVVTIELAAGSFELTDAAALRRRALGEMDEESAGELRRVLAAYSSEDQEAATSLLTVLESVTGDDGKGDAFLVTGPAGSGKTHLLGTLLLLAGADAARRDLARRDDEFTAPLRALHDAAPLLLVPVPLNEHRGRDELLEDIVFERTEIELRRPPCNLQVPLSQHAYALELIERYVAPRYEEELDQYVAEHQDGIGSWAELREVDEEAAVRVGYQFAQTMDYPLDFRQSRVERMARLLEVVDGERISGVLYLIDDLGHFLASADEKAMQGDCVFLEFLAHRGKIAPIWTVGALEVPLREIPGIDPQVARRISDMFSPGLALSTAHMRHVTRTMVRPASEEQNLSEAIAATYQAYQDALGTPSFSLEELTDSYPLDPLAAHCAEAMSSRLLGRADGLLTVMQKLTESGELEQRAQVQPVTLDRVLDLLLPQLRSYAEAASYVGEALEYYERNAAQVAPANPELLRRVARILVGLRLANLWLGPTAIREALGLTAAGEAAAEGQVVSDVLEAARLRGSFVEVRRGRQESEDVYYVEMRTAVTQALRERLAAARERLREDDPALMQCAAAHAGAALPLAELSETQTLEVRWRNTSRCLGVSCENLLALTALELDQQVQEISDTATVHDAHLYVAHLVQSRAQRSRWQELASGLMGGRWSAGVLAWVPRPLAQRELDVLLDCTACRALLQQERQAAAEQEAGLIQGLEEEESRLGAQVRDLVRAAYYEGTILSAFGEALHSEDLVPLDGDWAGTLNAAASWSLERIFPQFRGIAPRHFLSSREPIDALVDNFIRRGFVAADADAHLSDLIVAFLVPLGLVRQSEEGWVLDVAQSQPADEVMRCIRARDQTPETQRGRPLACADLAQHLLKSEHGLPPELFELLITALIRTGHLVGLDRNHNPVKLEQIPSPVSRHLQFVARPALLSYEQWGVLSRICRIVLDRVIASPGHVAQASIWETFVEERERWLTRIQSVRERTDQLRQRLGQPVRAWRQTTAALQHTERFFDLIDPNSYASEGLNRLLAGAGPFLETSNGISKLRDLLRLVALLEHFVDEVGPQLVQMQKYLTSEDLWLPDDSDLGATSCASGRSS